MDLYLCADCGGTKVKVCIADRNGPVSIGHGGPCNLKTIGADAALRAILTATTDAVSKLPTKSFPGPIPQFALIWVAMAGVQQPSDAADFHPYLCSGFNLPKDSPIIRVTNDCNLLAAPLLTHPGSDSCITIVAGTGSSGLAFRKKDLSSSSSATTIDSLQRVAVCRGWGYLLGDEGSAFHIGLLAVRSLLQADDDRVSSFGSLNSPHSSLSSLAMPSPAASPSPEHPSSSSSSSSRSSPPLPDHSHLPLHRDLLISLGVSKPSEVIHKAYSAHADTFEASESARKIWIAEAARTVLGYAFPNSLSSSSSITINGQGTPRPQPVVATTPSQQEALQIAYEAIDSLVSMIVRLVGDRSVILPLRSSLLLGGGLWQMVAFKNALLERLSSQGIVFDTVQVIPDAATAGAAALAAANTQL